MEIVSRCYAEGKGTEKDLAAASFWYERALRRGTPTMEDPAKNLDEKEKTRTALFQAEAYFETGC